MFLFFLPYAVPDLPPINFTSFPLNTTAIEMKWLHVPQEEQNGIILGYNVQLYDVAGNNIRNTTLDGANTTSVVLAGLEIWTNYSYRVSAFTVKGEGPWSAVAKSRTAEEGETRLVSVRPLTSGGNTCKNSRVVGSDFHFSSCLFEALQ